MHLGEVRRLRGDLPGALEVMAAGLEASRRLGVEASYGRYFALNAAEDEFELGHWDAAQERIDRLAGASLTWSETLLRLTVSGQLAAGRGEFERARAWLDEASGQLRESSATEWTAYVGACVIELLLTAGEPEQALATAAAELERVRGREEQLYTPALVAVAVRAAADVATTAGASAKRSASRPGCRTSSTTPLRRPPSRTWRARSPSAPARTARLQPSSGTASPAAGTGCITRTARRTPASGRPKPGSRDGDREAAAHALSMALTVAETLGAAHSRSGPIPSSPASACGGPSFASSSPPAPRNG